jgi:hypothetical protein
MTAVSRDSEGVFSEKLAVNVIDGPYKDVSMAASDVGSGCGFIFDVA